MTKVEELKKKLETTNRTPEEIDAILAKYKKSLETHDAIKIQYKSTRRKIAELMEGLDQKDCRFFNWTDGITIFVHRLPNNKATVTFAFLNPNDIECERNFDYCDREGRYYALLNFKSNKYTYEVNWKGRSEFAAYDVWVANHRTFPGMYKRFILTMTLINI